jgi:hypothetical protein
MFVSCLLFADSDRRLTAGSQYLLGQLFVFDRAGQHQPADALRYQRQRPVGLRGQPVGQVGFNLNEELPKLPLIAFARGLTGARNVGRQRRQRASVGDRVTASVACIGQYLNKR